MFAAGLVAFFLLVVIFLALGLTETASAQVAVTSAASLLLVAVTGGYVLLTYRLVRLQENPSTAIRLAAEDAAVRRLLELLNSEDSDALKRVARAFPVELTPDFVKRSRALLDIDRVNVMSQRLQEMNFSLPLELINPAGELCNRMIEGTGQVYVLGKLLGLFEIAAGMPLPDDPATKWATAEAEYEANIRHTSVHQREWTFLTTGASLLQAVRLNSEITTLAIQYLQVGPAGLPPHQL